MQCVAAGHRIAALANLHTANTGETMIHTGCNDLQGPARLCGPASCLTVWWPQEVLPKQSAAQLVYIIPPGAEVLLEYEMLGMLKRSGIPNPTIIMKHESFGQNNV